MKKTIFGMVTALTAFLTTAVHSTDSDEVAELVKIFGLWDSNADRIVAGTEYEAGGGAPRHYDPNKDGTLTLEEYLGYHGHGSAAKVPAAAPPGADPQLVKLFRRWDSNGNGIVEGDAEFNAGGDAPYHYDINQDGRLPLEEFLAYHSGERADRPTGIPAELPEGSYSCLHVYYDRLNKQAMMDPVGDLAILPGSSYNWLGEAAGSFSYASGQIEWSGGMLGDLEVTESTAEWKGDGLMIEIVLQTAKKTVTYRCYGPR